MNHQKEKGGAEPHKTPFQKPEKENGTGIALGLLCGTALGIAANQLALGLALGVALGIAWDEDKPAETAHIYRVQAGAFTDRANAESYKQKMVAAGFPGAFIVTA